MPTTSIGLCTIKLHLPGVKSLKEKRGILKSLLARLHSAFSVSAAEIDYLDVWQSSLIAIVVVSNSPVHVQRVLQNACDWIEHHFPNVTILDQELEVL